MSDTKPTNIEDHPRHILAEKVWGGTHWHYPALERLTDEMRGLRKSLETEHSFVRSLESRMRSLRVRLTAWQTEGEAWRAMYQAASGVINDSWPKVTLDEASKALKAARAETDRVIVENP